jgi:hypothetical protein
LSPFIGSLQILDKGRFSKTDYYVDHAVTDTKTTLLVTDRRLVLMSYDLFGQWQVGFFITLFHLTFHEDRVHLMRKDSFLFY